MLGLRPEHPGGPLRRLPWALGSSPRVTSGVGGAHPAKGAVPIRPTPSAAPGRPCAPRKHRCTRSGFKLVGIEEAQPLRPAVPQDHAYAPDEVVMRHVADVVPRSEEHTSELQSLMRTSY